LNLPLPTSSLLPDGDIYGRGAAFIDFRSILLPLYNEKKLRVIQALHLFFFIAGLWDAITTPGVIKINTKNLRSFFIIFLLLMFSHYNQ